MIPWVNKVSILFYSNPFYPSDKCLLLQCEGRLYFHNNLSASLCSLCGIGQLVQIACVGGRKSFAALAHMQPSLSTFSRLNSIWQAPTWSSLEYGGRWKVNQAFVDCYICLWLKLKISVKHARPCACNFSSQLFVVSNKIRELQGISWCFRDSLP